MRSEDIFVDVCHEGFLICHLAHIWYHDSNLIEFWHICRAHEPHNVLEKGFDWRFLTPEVSEMSGYLKTPAGKQ